MGFKTLISSLLATILLPIKGAEAGPDTRPAECAVCLSSLKGGTGSRVLPCRHKFHEACVERWLAMPHFKSTCPVCRFPVEGGGGVGEMRRQQDCFTVEMVIWFSSFHVAGF